MSSPLRGEVWLVDLGYAAKVRPCLVISIPVMEEDRALVTPIPHTTSRITCHPAFTLTKLDFLSLLRIG